MTVSSPVSAVLPWLDRFQRGRGVEGDVIFLGVDEGEVLFPYTSGRLVLIDRFTPSAVTKLSREALGELIIINEDPLEAIDTEAMRLEDGSYRIVSIHALSGIGALLEAASRLVLDGGLVLLSPWPGDMEFDPHITREYWEYLHNTARPLMRCGHEGETLLLTNDRVWQKDYEAVIAAAKLVA